MPENALLRRSAPVAVPACEKSAAVDWDPPSGAPYAEYDETPPALPTRFTQKPHKILMSAIMKSSMSFSLQQIQNRIQSKLELILNVRDRSSFLK